MSCLSHCCEQIYNQQQLRKGGDAVPDGSWLHGSTTERLLVTYQWVRKLRREYLPGSLLLCYFNQCGSLAHGMVLASFRIGFPPSVNPLCKFPYRYMQKCASLKPWDQEGILKPIKLPTNIYHHIERKRNDPTSWVQPIFKTTKGCVCGGVLKLAFCLQIFKSATGARVPWSQADWYKDEAKRSARTGSGRAWGTGEVVSFIPTLFRNRGMTLS